MRNREVTLTRARGLPHFTGVYVSHGDLSARHNCTLSIGNGSGNLTAITLRQQRRSSQQQHGQHHRQRPAKSHFGPPQQL